LGEENLRQAEKLYQRAIALDPKFARARCGLAQTYLTAVVIASRWPEALEGAEREAARAMLLDQNLGGVELVLGQTNAYRGNWLAAEIHFRSAAERDQSLADDTPIRALFLASVGSLAAACREAGARFKSNPAKAEAAASLSVMSSLAGRDTEAVKYADLALSLGAGNVTGLALAYSHAARRAGIFEEAAERAMEALPSDVRQAGAREVVTQVYAAMGDHTRRTTAIRALHELQQTAAEAGMDSGLMVLLAMDWYTSLGDLDRAFDTAFSALERFKRSNTAVAWAAIWLPEMRPFHRDPRFQVFAEHLGLMEYWKQFGPPDHFELRDGKLVCL
jgi:tetratricopeptide (TPR) repeat protein